MIDSVSDPDGSTPEDVAAWMLVELQSKGVLHHEDAVAAIEAHFGSPYVYSNENGNPAIDWRVLRAFRRLHAGLAVWDRSEKWWVLERRA